jgi:hypothetical protein
MKLEISSSEPEYPPPPRVHWLVLLGVSVILDFIIDYYAPKPFQEILTSLAVDGWAFYLCLWIRKLDHETLSPFWCDVYVVVELAFSAMSIGQHPSAHIQVISSILGFASAVLGIATIFLIRRDLVKHYSEREDFTLVLGPFMSFFFSFFYFQYHLYDIAEQKLKERNSVAT